MFSAVKFIAAGVIVVLFGGFLLAGILTTPQGDEMAPAAVTESSEPEVTDEATEPPTTSARTDILPNVALNVEEVEPGVFQVVNDGVRDLAKANNRNVVAGHDGGIWLARKNRFLRLGSEELREWPNKKHGVPDDFEVAPDGTVWAMSGGHLYSVGSGSDDWTRTKGPVDGFSDQLEGSAFWVTSDGTVWAMWGDPSETKVFGYLGADGWQSVGERPRSKFSELLVSDRGDIWAYGKVADTGNLIHLVDGAWRTYDGVPGLAGGRAVGADGTFWGSSSDDFVRFDGTEWMTFARPDWVPDGRRGTDHPLRVAPDSSVWFGPTRTDIYTSARSPRRPCRGVGHFDGISWGRYLPDLCVEVMDVAADGKVWVLASRDDTDDSLPNHVYVITPEAVAATE